MRRCAQGAQTGDALSAPHRRVARAARSDRRVRSHHAPTYRTRVHPGATSAAHAARQTTGAARERRAHHRARRGRRVRREAARLRRRAGDRGSGGPSGATDQVDRRSHGSVRLRRARARARGRGRDRGRSRRAHPRAAHRRCGCGWRVFDPSAFECAGRHARDHDGGRPLRRAGLRRASARALSEQAQHRLVSRRRSADRVWRNRAAHRCRGTRAGDRPGADPSAQPAQRGARERQDGERPGDGGAVAARMPRSIARAHELRGAAFGAGQRAARRATPRHRAVGIPGADGAGARFLRCRERADLRSRRLHRATRTRRLGELRGEHARSGAGQRNRADATGGERVGHSAVSGADRRCGHRRDSGGRWYVRLAWHVDRRRGNAACRQSDARAFAGRCRRAAGCRCSQHRVRAGRDPLTWQRRG